MKKLRKKRNQIPEEEKKWFPHDWWSTRLYSFFFDSNIDEYFGFEDLSNKYTWGYMKSSFLLYETSGVRKWYYQRLIETELLVRCWNKENIQAVLRRN